MTRKPPLHAFAVALLLGASAAAHAAKPFDEVHVAANRDRYTGHCPVTIVYSATVRFQPHDRGFVFNYHWERTNGSKGPVRRVRVSPGERSMLLRESSRVGRSGEERDAAATLYLNSGDTHERHLSPTIHVVCR